MPEFTVQDLHSILRDCAGEHGVASLHEKNLGASFEELGCDSLAVLNMVVRIERDFGVVLPDHVISEARTPSALIRTVNAI
ncbi:acyl carrier protein [Streptomyces noursei]|uniref:acyl carrier protein n=1 Tax=Streptomyces noursei TaxID=1971 RepID=UPI0034063C00